LTRGKEKIPGSERGSSAGRRCTAPPRKKKTPSPGKKAGEKGKKKEGSLVNWKRPAPVTGGANNLESEKRRRTLLERKKGKRSPIINIPFLPGGEGGALAGEGKGRDTESGL